MGCILLIVEAANMVYEEDLIAYKEQRRTTKPKFRLVCFEPSSLGWWGGVSYTTGALLYNIGAAPTYNMQYMTSRRSRRALRSEAAPSARPDAIPSAVHVSTACSEGQARR